MNKIFTFCKRYLHMHKWRLLIYILVSVIVSASSLASPFIIGDFIDQLMAADGIGFIYRYFILFTGINITSLLLGYISGRLYAQLQTRLGYALNRDLIERMQRVPLGFTDKQDRAYLNQRINNDSNALIIFCIGIIQSILVNAVLIAVALGLMFVFHPTLALVLLGVALVYFVFYTFYKKILYKSSHAFQESQSKFFAKLNEQMFSIRFIKLHSLFSQFIGRLNNSFENLLKNALGYQKATYIFGGLDRFVMIAAQMILLLFGGMEIIAGRLTIGRFIIISSYFNLMLGAMRYFFSLGQTIQDNTVSYNRLQELIAVEPEPNGLVQLNEIREIEFKSVSFSYGDKAVLTDVSRVFARGRIHSVTGPNGSGKSTLVDVLLGLQTGNYSGTVLFNGQPMEQIDMYKARAALFGVSEQEPVLMADTIAYNLDPAETGMVGIDFETVSKLSKILGLEPYFKTLSAGLDTPINESAANISGGEKQKLAILRALLKDPDVLILDEPTSALDTNSKSALKAYLEEIKANKIIIVVTHDVDFVGQES